MKSELRHKSLLPRRTFFCQQLFFGTVFAHILSQRVAHFKRKATLELDNEYEKRNGPKTDTVCPVAKQAYRMAHPCGDSGKSDETPPRPRSTPLATRTQACRIRRRFDSHSAVKARRITRLPTTVATEPPTPEYPPSVRNAPTDVNPTCGSGFQLCRTTVVPLRLGEVYE